ncbi:sensor histidine kinase [Candidatus Bathyarchaeota archaeon]|nr:sensor histidine kinase [Candidatus Bathyarchaeota archaeon]
MRLTEAEPKLVPESMISVDKALFKTECGPFTLEFRVWDLDSESLLSLAERFDLEKKVRAVRNQISDNPYSGISVYRDGIIVLPKVTSAARKSGADRKTAEAGRDWLGLNLRRVSRVGKRISANQIVGYVDVSADSNPGLRDTSDRERLIDNEASRQFKEFLFKVVWFLEAEREKDKTAPGHQEPPLQDLFEGLKSPRLVAKIAELEKRSAGWEEIRGAIDEHTQELESAVDEIQSRFYYYSRLATVGSLALLLQHEVGNKVTVIEELLKHLRESTEVPIPSRTEKRLQLAESSVRSLQRLADTFAPLATRTFGTRRRDCLVENVLDDIRGWHEKELAKETVLFKVKSDGNNKVAVDPGELAAVFENLMTNSLYWLCKVDANNRRVLVEVQPNSNAQRVDIAFHDSGPGVEDGYEEMIFWPGVTKKEGGIGMGLTVASELVAQYGGKMHFIKPGKLGGASFGFDLPCARR